MRLESAPHAGHETDSVMTKHWLASLCCSPWSSRCCPRCRQPVYHGWRWPHSSLHIYSPSVGAACACTSRDGLCEQYRSHPVCVWVVVVHWCGGGVWGEGGGDMRPQFTLTNILPKSGCTPHCSTLAPLTAMSSSVLMATHRTWPTGMEGWRRCGGYISCDIQ